MWQSVEIRGSVKSKLVDGNRRPRMRRAKQGNSQQCLGACAILEIGVYNAS